MCVNRCVAKQPAVRLCCKIDAGLGALPLCPRAKLTRARDELSSPSLPSTPAPTPHPPERMSRPAAPAASRRDVRERARGRTGRVRLVFSRPRGACRVARDPLVRGARGRVGCAAARVPLGTRRARRAALRGSRAGVRRRLDDLARELVQPELQRNLPARRDPKPHRRTAGRRRRRAFVDVDDIAEVATAAFLDSRHVGEVYELTGPRLLTFGEAIAEIAQACGQAIDFVRVAPRDYTAALTPVTSRR